VEKRCDADYSRTDVTTPTDELAGWGLAEFNAGQKNVTWLHFHVCDEFAFMVAGKMLIRSEGVDFVVVSRDLVVAWMGDEHEILEILEDTRSFRLEGAPCGQNRHGHLHRRRETGQ
jgi:hypothetical protein